MFLSDYQSLWPLSQRNQLLATWLMVLFGVGEVRDPTTLVLICFFKSHPRPVRLPERWDSGAAHDLAASEPQGAAGLSAGCYLHVINIKCV